MMDFICTQSYDEMSIKAAAIISAQLINKPASVLGLATGSSPLGTYSYLSEWYSQGIIDFSQAKSINLDEYADISPDNKQSYHYYMHKNLFSKVNINPDNTYIPSSEKEVAAACFEYDSIIERLGGIDLMLLGIGHNGHIGFNEPSDRLEKNTHCVELAKSTIAANSRFFSSADTVLTKALTMGIKQIMQARKILLIVSGKDKAKIVEKAFFGDITPLVPASVLQLHQNVTVIGDKEAFSKIANYI